MGGVRARRCRSGLLATAILDGQQHARPGDRPAGGQADAGGAARARPRARRCTRRWSTARSLTGAAGLGARRRPACRRGCCCRWLALPLAPPLVRDRAQPHGRRRRSTARSRGTGMLQLVFCVLLSRRACCCRADRSRSAPVAQRLAPRRARRLGRAARARVPARAARLRPGRLGRGRGGAARALRRRRRSPPCARRWTRYARVLASATDRSELLAACAAERDLPQALAAIDLALWDRRSRRAGTPVARLIDPRRARRGAGQRDDRRRGPGRRRRRRARPRATASAREGQGRDRRRRRPAGRGARGGRARTSRSAIDANGAWGTPEEALANLRALAPVGIELCEEPVHGVEALRAVRARVAGPDRHGRDARARRGRDRRVCLKITARRDHRRAGGRPRRARRGLGGLRRAHLRRPARHRRRRARGRRRCARVVHCGLPATGSEAPLGFMRQPGLGA